MINSIESESAFLEEKSIFHTSEPRDSKTKVHLILVFLCLVSSLGVAIVFAETGGLSLPVAANRTLLKEANNQWSHYGKSE